MQAEPDDVPRLERTLRGHRGPVTGVAFSPDASPSCFSSSLKSSTKQRRRQQHLLASSSLDGLLTLWNFPLSCSEDSKNDESSRRGGVSKKSNVGSGKGEVRAYRFLGHTAPVHHVTFSPSGNLLASGSSDRTVRLWVPNATGDSVILKGHSGPVRCVDFSRANLSSTLTNSLLITCSDDKSVKVWTLPHKKFKCSLVGHSNWVKCCKFSPDTPHLAASGGDDRTVRIWDVERGSELTTYSDLITGTTTMTGGGGVNQVAFHNSGTALASGAMDGSIRLYDIRSDVLIQHYPRAVGVDSVANVGVAVGVTSLSFHSSGNYLLSSCASGSLKIWDVREGRLLHAVRNCGTTEKSTFNGVSCAAFSSDGAHFASSGGGGDEAQSDRNVMVWKSNLRSYVGGCKDGVTTPTYQRSPSSPSKTVRNNAVWRSGPTSSKKLNTNSSPSRSLSPKKKGQKNYHKACGNNIKKYVIEDIAGEDVIHQPDNLEHTISSGEQQHPQQQQQWTDFQESLVPPLASNSVQYEKNRLPEVLAGTLDHIVGQLDMLTQTVAMIDKRLSIQENAMAQILAERAEESLRIDEDMASMTQTSQQGRNDNIKTKISPKNSNKKTKNSPKKDNELNTDHVQFGFENNITISEVPCKEQKLSPSNTCKTNVSNSGKSSK